MDVAPDVAPDSGPDKPNGVSSAAEPDPSVVGKAPESGLTVIIVTFNSAGQIAALLEDLRLQESAPRLKVVVVDNCSEDSTRSVVAACGNAELVEAHSNLGYAGAINLAVRSTQPKGAVLVLNPDLRLAPDAVAKLVARMRMTGAGATVPLMLDADGEVFRSLRFEPTLLGSLGDAILGARLSSRPSWATETDFSAESYQLPHTVKWATGAAILISADAVHDVGEWNEEYFLYSEETDYLRRLRDAGYSIWFEPRARVTHAGAGSGSSPELDALLAVNRVRYGERYHGRSYAVAARAIALLAASLRLHRSPGNRLAWRYLLRRGQWESLPHAGRGATSNGMSDR